MTDHKPIQLTLEDGQRALGVHVLEKGHQLRKKYGNFIDYEILESILKDNDFVRYPARIIFDSSRVEQGLFACAEKIAEDPSDGYIIYVHEYFKNKLGDVPALVLYQLVTVNYGDFASCHEAEEFGSAALGMEKEYYYQYICRLADSIPD